MAAVCLGFHPSLTMKRRGRRWWTCPDINVCILAYCPLLALRARTIGNFLEWILWAPWQDKALQAPLCLQGSSSAPKRWTLQITSLCSISNHHISTPQFLIVSTAFSWFQKSGELKDMFTFQMQAYFPNIILPALETEAWLSGNRPNPHRLSSIHKVLEEVQPLHIFALNNFATVSAERDSTCFVFLSNYHILYCPEQIPLPWHTHCSAALSTECFCLKKYLCLLL